MTRIDGIEKLGRFVLWIAMASVFVLVPLSVLSREQADEGLKKAAADAQEKLAKALEDKGPQRLTLASMGARMSALNSTAAEGRVFFSNVSPRSGVICITGTATNPNTGDSTQSLATCQEVAPYASNVRIAVQFAGADLEAVCKGVACKLTIEDEPDAAPVAATSVAGAP